MLCKGITKNGMSCARKTKNKSGFCHFHVAQIIPLKFIDEQPDDCIVCLEKLTMDAPLECGHWIHLDCIKKSIRPECPICRFNMSHHFSSEELQNIKYNAEDVIDEWE